MLPLQFQQQYAHFQQQVAELQQRVQTDRDLGRLKVAVQQLVLFFQSKLWQPNPDELPPNIAPLVQSYQVEIDKQLRLLGLDLSFLQAARQPQTFAQRQQQLHDRLTRLSQYCEAVLAAISQP